MGKTNFGAFVVVCLWALAAGAEVKVDSSTFGAIEARAIGPAVMSGRIAAIDGVASDPRVIYVGAAAGGVWKTTNGGTTFKPVLDKHTQSIGAIAVDQAHPGTVWVGAGESWVRNSVSVGTGVYKTTDGGENWQFMGLGDSERIGKIVVDPKNSDVVYVAALGHLWNGNEERGLYKTTDGGKSWKRMLYVDANTGCSDVAIDPQETNVVYAAMWQFRRYAWEFRSGGAGSGLYRSLNGGQTWERIKAGLPEGELGRIAIAVARSRPSVVYATVEAKKSALYRSDDMGKTWMQVNASAAMGARPFYFSLLVVDPKDHQRVYKPGGMLSISKNGGRTFTEVGGYHPDLHALWVDPTQPATLWLGTDGGVYRSMDYGGTWSFVRNLPVSQFYHVTYDLERPYNIYGGLQDNGSWMGPSQGPSGVQNKDWRNVGFGDGFYVFPHPTDKNVVYSQYQGGKLLRFHKTTGEIKAIAPQPKAGEPRYRFNWNAAVALSARDPDTLYIGAQFLFRSRDRGESWERISPDLTTDDKAKQNQEKSGGLTIDNSTAENHCTIYTIAESPLERNAIWVGTDDGNVQVTRDGGKTWTNVTGNVAGVPRNTWVSSMEASRHHAGTAYATFDGHHSGDMQTYVYRTTDFGKSWTPLATDAIKGFAHVIREDRVKPDLLFLGTEFGLYLTVDGGRQWAQFTGNFPSVPVRDLAIHPRESDLIVATHGRGIYVVDDIAGIRQITPRLLESKLAVLETRPFPIRVSASEQSFPGNDEFVGANPPEVAFITYYLKERHVLGDFSIQVFDAEGKLVTTLAPGKRRGINRVPWAMRLKPPRVPAAPSLEFGSLTGPMAPEGTYTVKLAKGEDTYTASIRLTGDPASPHSAEDRKLQQTAVMRLYRMLERLAYVAAAVAEARDQARARAGKLTDGDAVGRELGAFAGKLDALHRTLVAQSENRLSGERRLREQIGELYGEVSRYGGRPTKSQTERAGVLEQEVEQASRSFDAELEGLNAKLAREPIRKLTPAEYERRPR